MTSLKLIRLLQNLGLFLLFLSFWSNLIINISLAVTNLEENTSYIVSLKIDYEDSDALVTVYEDNNHDIWIDKKDLTSINLEPDYLNSGTTTSKDNNDYVSLKSLQGTSFKLDEQNLDLIINFPVKGLKQQDFDYRDSLAEEKINNSAKSILLNYDLTISRNDSATYLAGLQELDITLNKGSIVNSFLLRHNFKTSNRHNHKSMRDSIRLETYWLNDEIDKMASWKIGDAISASADWSGSTRFAGVQYATNFAVKPNFTSYPLLSFAGVSELPSTIDVFANSLPIYTKESKSGKFDINNIPVTTGRGDLVVRVKDIAGKVQTITMPYFISPILLKPGLADFSYSAGLQRQNYGARSYEYSRLVTSIDYMYGMNDRWTLGGHFESLSDNFAVGTTNIFNLNRFGILSVSLANSNHSLSLKNVRSNAQRFKVDYTTDIGKLTYSTSLTYDWGNFMDTFINPRDYKVILGRAGNVYRTSLSYCSGDYGTIFGSFTRLTTINSNLSKSKADLIGASYQYNINKNININLNVGSSINSKPDKQRQNYGSLSLIASMDNKSISLSSSKTSKQNLNKSIQISSSIIGQKGWGYNATINNPENKKQRTFDFEIDRYGDYGDISLYSFSDNARRSDQISLTGNVIGINKNIYFTRPSNNSFLLVKVADVKNVPIYNNNQLIGKTDANGTLLIPNVPAYVISETRVDERKLPFNVKFSDLTLHTAPRPKSGVIVNFDITKVRPLEMTLKDHHGKLFEVNRAVHIDGVADDQYVGYNGNLYITDIKDLNRIEGKSCNESQECCSFDILIDPSNKADIIDLGDVICK